VLRDNDDDNELVPVLFLTEHHAMKASWDWRYRSMHSLTSALDEGEWSASRSGRFTQRKGTQVPLYTRLCGSQSCSGRGGEEKNSRLRQGSKPTTAIVQPDDDDDDDGGANLGGIFITNIMQTSATVYRYL